jgi:hypothetical protein
LAQADGDAAAEGEKSESKEESGFNANQAAEKVHFLSPGYHEAMANSNFPNMRTTYYS